jgi:23S rRNA pseudouridine1911/1915/1917 synthase
MQWNHKVDATEHGFPLKKILKEKFHLSKKVITKLKQDGQVTRNQVPCRLTDRVEEGDFLFVQVEFRDESTPVLPQNIPLNILYEDEHLIAVDKKPGMVVHPTRNHTNHTIANGLLYYFQQKDQTIKIRPVSRLDRDTTGILIFAKNPFIQARLIAQMKEQVFLKEYLGVVSGLLPEESGVIDLPISRKEGSIIERQTTEHGAPSITHYHVLKKLEDATWVSFRLLTGRTHQIRVHCKAIGHPLMGDTLYGPYESPLIKRQALHAHTNEFIHPFTLKPLKLTSPLPEDIRSLIQKLELKK